MLKRPPSGDPYLTYLVGALEGFFARREPLVVGLRFDGTDLQLRFRAALAAPWVEVHVQSSASGEGGSAYDPSNYHTSEVVDCRSELLQDYTVSAPTIGVRYTIWLIPIQHDGLGNQALYDGQGGRPDNMAYADSGMIP